MDTSFSYTHVDHQSTYSTTDICNYTYFMRAHSYTNVCIFRVIWNFDRNQCIVTPGTNGIYYCVHYIQLWCYGEYFN